MVVTVVSLVRENGENYVGVVTGSVSDTEKRNLFNQFNVSPKEDIKFTLFNVVTGGADKLKEIMNIYD